jgi:hypothetical protein
MSNPFPQPSVCSEPLLFSFNDLGSRKVMADFSAGYLSSDGGMLFLRQIDEGLGISCSKALTKRRRYGPIGPVRRRISNFACEK